MQKFESPFTGIRRYINLRPIKGCSIGFVITTNDDQDGMQFTESVHLNKSTNVTFINKEVEKNNAF